MNFLLVAIACVASLWSASALCVRCAGHTAAANVGALPEGLPKILPGYAVLPAAELADFERELSGTVEFPVAGGYANATVQWNTRFVTAPAMFVYAAEEEDVILAVAFARRHAMRLVVRAGGHNVEGWSLCNACLAIDLSRLNQVRENRQKSAVNECVIRRRCMHRLPLTKRPCWRPYKPEPCLTHTCA